MCILLVSGNDLVVPGASEHSAPWQGTFCHEHRAVDDQGFGKLDIVVGTGLSDMRRITLAHFTRSLPPRWSSVC